MKYVTYLAESGARVGVVDGDHVRPLSGISDLSQLDSTRLRLADYEDETLSLSALTLLPSSSRPSKILCVGLNYKSHVAETNRDLPVYPVLFAKFSSNLIGAADEIVVPPESSQVDFEGELAVIIGMPGRRIPIEDALSYVLGYSVANDVTMRDYQYKTHQWIQGKAWDRSTPLGPFVVTPDEVAIESARITTTLNGEIVQQSDLSKLIFPIPQLIHDISEFTTLVPGDIILTGTPSGVGYRREPQLFLGDGDVVEVEVEGVGIITNRVAAE